MEDFSDENIRKNCPHCDIHNMAFTCLIKETDGFHVVHDANPLCEGHLLIIPKQHISCIGEYTDKLLEEFKKVYQEFSDYLKERYGKVSTFEHGIVGQTVYHSHVHLLPFDGKPTDIIPEGTDKIFKISLIDNLEEVFLRQGKYLFFSIGDNSWLVGTSLAAPRFFRDRFAQALGKPERGNWKEMRQNPSIHEAGDRDIENFKAQWKNQ